VVAFVVSLLISGLMVAIIVRVGRNRPVGTPLTWGEAFVAGVFVFLLLFLLYGVVPHQWLAFADNQLGWRSDKIGIPLGPLGHAMNGKLGAKEGVLFPEGIPLPNGHFIVTAQILRDIIAATLYIVFLLVQIKMWLWWQKRDQRKPGDQAELTSAYGRPLVRGS
jgi:hypothetical protein